MKVSDTFLLWDAARVLTGRACIVRVRQPWNKTTKGRASKSEFFAYIDLARYPGKDPLFLWTFLHECGHHRAGHLTKASTIHFQDPSEWRKPTPSPERERQANNWAQGWFRLAKRLSSEKKWRPMLRALINYYGE
jgi:hypothetical protein